MRSTLVAAVEGWSDEDGDSDLLCGVGELLDDGLSVTRLVGLFGFEISSTTSPSAPIDFLLAKGEPERSTDRSLCSVLLLTSASQLEKGDVPPVAVEFAQEPELLAAEANDDRVELDRMGTALFLALTKAVA